MADIKTQSFVIDGKTSYSKNLTTKQLQTIQVEQKPQQLKTIREQIEDIKQGAQDTRRITQINQFASYFPKFYKKETKNALIMFCVWLSLLAVSLGVIGYGIYAVLKSHDSNWLCLLFIPPFLILAGVFVVYTGRYFNFRSEAKTINFKDEKTLSINVQKLYKRLKTGHINVNWMCLTSYVVFGLFILFVFIVAKILNGTKFGTWDPSKLGGDYIYEILFFSGLAALIITGLLHVGLLVCNYLRAARIENFYNFMIVNQEELNVIKKQKNKRDLIIFLTSCLVIGVIIYLIYKLVKRNKAVKVAVS